MFNPMTTLTLLTAAVTGALFYRMRGGAPSWPRPLEQMLFCIVFGVVMAAMGVPFWAQVIAYALAVAATLTGHGQYFLSMTVKPIEPERLDFLVRLVFGRDPRTDARFRQYWADDDNDEPGWMDGYNDAVHEIQGMVASYGPRRLFARCAFGLGVTGWAVSLAPGLAVMVFTTHLWAGLALCLSGFVAKAAAYLISHAAGKGTEGGEWITGGLQWLFAVAIAMMVV